jgi:hypothetical protein
MFVNTFNLILKYMSPIDDNHHLSLRLPGAGRAGNIHGPNCCRAEMEGKMADHRSANTVRNEKMSADREGDPSATIRRRVHAARDIQRFDS